MDFFHLPITSYDSLGADVTPVENGCFSLILVYLNCMCLVHMFIYASRKYADTQPDLVYLASLGNEGFQRTGYSCLVYFSVSVYTSSFFFFFFFLLII